MSDNTDFVAEARTKCAMSIRNTAVGDWLGDALRRLEEADAENAQLRERCHELTDLCDNRLKQRWDANTEYRAEVERLREELKASKNLATNRRYQIEALREQVFSVSEIAHLGGLRNLSESEALNEIRKLTCNKFREALEGGGDEQT